jgi:hypothetical protein
VDVDPELGADMLRHGRGPSKISSGSVPKGANGKITVLVVDEAAATLIEIGQRRATRCPESFTGRIHRKVDRAVP